MVYHATVDMRGAFGAPQLQATGACAFCGMHACDLRARAARLSVKGFGWSINRPDVPRVRSTLKKLLYICYFVTVWTMDSGLPAAACIRRGEREGCCQGLRRRSGSIIQCRAASKTARFKNKS